MQERGTFGAGYCVSLVAQALLVLILVAGCGSDEGRDKASAVGAADTATSTTPPDAPATTATPPPTAPTTTAVVAATPSSTRPATTTTTGRALSLEGFQTPTYNIACSQSADKVRCDIAERSWTPPPKPSSCDLDWGNGLYLDETGAGVVCAGDTNLDRTLPVLAYGETSRAGDIDCTSRQDGLTCTNRRSRHGFFLSRQRYQLD